MPVPSQTTSTLPRRRGPRRVLAWLLGGLLGLPLLLAGLVWWQQDKIIALVVGQASQRLAVLVRVGRIELSPWANFPDVTIRLDSVTIQESCLGQRYRMAALRDLSATIGFWDVLRGEYKVKELLVGPGWVRMRILPDGTPNWDLLKRDTLPAQNAAQRQPVRFDLSGIRADSVRYSFEDQRAGAAPLGLSLYLYRVLAGVSVVDSLVHIQTQGRLLGRRLTIGSRRYMEELPIGLDAQAELVMGQRLTLLPGGSYELGQAKFGLQGQVRLDVPQGSLYNLSLTSRESSLQAISVLLPLELRQTIGRYQTRGRVYFEAKAVKKIAKSRYPAITLAFGAKGAEFMEPTQKLRFVQTSFTGGLSIPEGDNLTRARLSLEHVSGQLDGRPFSARLQVQNLDRPELSGQVSATLPLALFADKLAQAQVYQPAGLCKLEVRFWQGAKGRGALPAGSLQADGSVDLQALSFATGPRRLPFTAWSGQLSLTGENIVAQGLRGFVGRSDLELDGHFEGLLGYLTGKRPALGMEVALRSNLLDMDELLSARQAPAGREGEVPTTAPRQTAGQERYRFAIAPGLRLEASCRVGQLRFRRFSPRALQGRLSIEGQRARFSQVRFYETGGTVTCEGTLDAATPGRVSLQGHFAGSGVLMDSLFYVMEDFEQQTLRHNQIHGRLRTTGNVALVMDQTLDIDPKSVLADADVTLTDGQLLFFEPAQALGRFIDKEELKNLQFSELQNHFTIRGGVLYIPQMEIKSNIIEVGVEGSHAFSQEMDYHLRVPMRYITGAAMGQSPKPGSSEGGNLFLTLKGRPGATRIGYDVVAVRKKMGQDIKEEKKKFLDLFRKRKKEETTPDQLPPPTEAPVAQDRVKEPGFFDLD